MLKKISVITIIVQPVSFVLFFVAPIFFAYIFSFWLNDVKTAAGISAMIFSGLSFLSGIFGIALSIIIYRKKNRDLYTFAVANLFLGIFSLLYWLLVILFALSFVFGDISPGNGIY